jgi:cation transport regulator ChaB
VLPTAAQAVWSAAFAEAWESADGTDDLRDARAAMAAWDAIKKQFKKAAAGKWVQRGVARLREMAEYVERENAMAERLQATGAVTPKRLLFETDQEFAERSRGLPRQRIEYDTWSGQRGIVRREAPGALPKALRDPRLIWRTDERKALLQHAAQVTSEPSFGQPPQDFGSHRYIVDQLTPIFRDLLRAIIRKGFDPALIREAAAKVAAIKESMAGRPNVAAIWEALDLGRGKVELEGMAVNVQDLDRAAALLREALRVHFPEVKPQEAPSVGELMAASFTRKALRRVPARPPEPVRSPTEVLRSVQTYQRMTAWPAPGAGGRSRIAQMVRASVGLDRSDANPMALDPWRAAPVPYAREAFPGQAEPRRSVLDTAQSLGQSRRPDGLRFATPEAAWLYGPAGRGEAPPEGVAVIEIGNPVGDAQARTLRANFMAAALSQIASIG